MHIIIIIIIISKNTDSLGNYVLNIYMQVKKKNHYILFTPLSYPTREEKGNTKHTLYLSSRKGKPLGEKEIKTKTQVYKNNFSDKRLIFFPVVEK